MVLLDVRIEIEKGGKWTQRNTQINVLRQQSFARLKSKVSKDDSASTSEQQRGMNLQLYRAATDNKPDTFLKVLEEILDENEKLTTDEILGSVTPLGNTLLHVASTLGNDNIVMLIAYHFPSIISKKNSIGDTALHVAAKSGHGSTILNLLRSLNCQRNSCQVQQRPLILENDEGNTALHEALMNTSFQVPSRLFYQDPESAFLLSRNQESPLYLAAKSGDQKSIEYIFDLGSEDELSFRKKIDTDERLKGKSAFHAAILHAATIRKQTDIIYHLLEKEPKFINTRDEKGRTPLHLMSFLGYLDGVTFLLSKNDSAAFERDNDGMFPIHLASIEGHIDVIAKLRQDSLNMEEMLDSNGRNILHLAACYGRLNVVDYVLKSPEMKNIINQQDKNGNTPLHLATMNWHPMIVSTLTWNDKVYMHTINNKGFTPLDAAETYMEKFPSFRKRLTWRALKSAGAPRDLSTKVLEGERQTISTTDMEKYKNRVDTLLLVSILIATVTFAAGFTMPGGYNIPDSKSSSTQSSESDTGMATLLRHNMFHLFIFCDTIAFYSSLIVAVTLIWAQLGDIKLVLIALSLAIPLLGVALLMMSLSFMAGVRLVVSNLNWLANSVLTMGLVVLAVLSLLFFPLCLPISSNRVIRYISYYPFCLLLWVSGSYKTEGCSKLLCIEADTVDKVTENSNALSPEAGQADKGNKISNNNHNTSGAETDTKDKGTANNSTSSVEADTGDKGTVNNKKSCPLAKKDKRKGKQKT